MTPWAAEGQAGCVQPLSTLRLLGLVVVPAPRQSTVPSDQGASCLSSGAWVLLLPQGILDHRLVWSGEVAAHIGSSKEADGPCCPRPATPTQPEARPGRPSGWDEQGPLGALPGIGPADAPSGCPSP